MIGKKNEPDLHKAYHEYESKKILQFGTIGSILGIIFTSSFAIQDIFIIQKIYYLPGRLFAFVPSCIFIILRFTLFKKHFKYIRPAQVILLSGFMYVAVYLLIIEKWNHLTLQGFFVIIIYVFVLYIGKPFKLLLIYLIPFSIIILYYYFTSGITNEFISALSNPIGLIAGAYFLTHMLHNLRVKEFNSSYLLQESNQKHIDELTRAKNIQMQLIPEKDPLLKGIIIQSYYKPMYEIGGDYYDYITFSEDSKAGIFISDIEGHGIPAALSTGIIKSLFQQSDYKTKNNPSKLLSYINSSMIQLSGKTYFTSLYCIFDLRKMKLMYSRGGHCHPILIRNNKAEIMISKGPFMGLTDSLTFYNNEQKLEHGDTIILYTDGLVETTNEKDEEFYNTFIQKVLPQVSQVDQNNIIDVINKNLMQFTNNEFDDDICILVINIE